MNTGKKIAWGLGLAGGALLAAWLLTGDRKKKTKAFVGKQAKTLKDAFSGKEATSSNEPDQHYI